MAQLNTLIEGFKGKILEKEEEVSKSHTQVEENEIDIEKLKTQLITAEENTRTQTETLDARSQEL